MKMYNYNEDSRGISLVALVITIVVLIILSATAVFMFQEQMFKKAKDTVTKNNEIVIKEKIEIMLANIETDYYREYFKDNNTKKSDFYTYENVSKYLGGEGSVIEDKFYYDIEKGKTYFVYKDKELYYDIVIDEKGNLSNEIIGSKENAITPFKVAQNPSIYYGQTIHNYKTGNTNIDNNVVWKVYHSDHESIYLITEDYIPYEIIPQTPNGNSVIKSRDENQPRAIYFSEEFLEEYNGTSDIQDEKIKALNYNYLIENKFESENGNMKAVAFLLDTSIWSSYKDTTLYADYVIGTPTLELFLASYKNKTGVDIKYNSNNIGYSVSSNGISYGNAINGIIPTTETLYVRPNYENGGFANSCWIASPAVLGQNSIFTLNRQGNLGGTKYNYTTLGIRPVVCLKAGIGLEWIDEKLQIKP